MFARWHRRVISTAFNFSLFLSVSVEMGYSMPRYHHFPCICPVATPQGHGSVPPSCYGFMYLSTVSISTGSVTCLICSPLPRPVFSRLVKYLAAVHSIGDQKCLRFGPQHSNAGSTLCSRKRWCYTMIAYFMIYRPWLLIVSSGSTFPVRCEV